VLYHDNQGAQKLACNPVYQNRTKHVDICHHFACETVESKEIIQKYIPTEQMVADILVKGLNGPKHKGFVGGLGLKSLD
jgi:hypothetical protein